MSCSKPHTYFQPIDYVIREYMTKAVESEEKKKKKEA